MTQKPPHELVLDLLTQAHASPLPRDEVIARIATAMGLHLNYLQYREMRGSHTSTDVQMEQELEALASAIYYLQQQTPQG